MHLAMKRGMNPFKPGEMMFVLLGLALLFATSSYSQGNFTIFLVGDAGDHTESGETLVNLHKELVGQPNSAVIFLGDNSYKDILGGIIPFGYKGFDSSRNTMEKIRSQLSLLDQYKGYVYFTPGNHDWWNRSTFQKGKPKLAMEESFIEANSALNTTIANPGQVFLPSGGQYGPAFVELNHRSIRVIFLDTYRIIQTGIKKSKVPEEEKSVYQKLDSIIKEGYQLKEQVMVVAHHPVYFKGPHNRILKHPYFFARIKASNASFPSYRKMADSIREVLKRYPGIYYVSGHVHALQYFYAPDQVHYIVSGAGSKENKLSGKEIKKYDASLSPDEYLLWNSGGFFKLDFSAGKIQTTLFYHDGALKCFLP
jgi:UDP-2,3-diacylglucosamine pyrophosphatase LpxH